MSRETFDRELQALQDRVISLGSQVSAMLMDSVLFLKTRDMKGSREIIKTDHKVNEMRYAIEEEVLALIALRQPAAIDLRTLAAILEIAGELERIGDYAKGIGKINLLIGEETLIKPIIDLPIMAQKVQSMLDRVLEAFIDRDIEAARAIPKDDDEIDDFYKQVYTELAALIMAKPSRLEQANYLLWAAHNLERSGDRVINLCERIIFTVTGKLEEID
ncbi:MAG: phosphate signaling complex protein PhoU [Anaerolineaceae bacterium]|nr:phosphate signaling complex protein PhoU [Anaerolineaceae bacterium]